MKLSPSRLAVALIWAFVMASALFLGAAKELPELPPAPAGFSAVMTVTILATPILFFGVMAFWARHSPFYHPILARYVDARLGNGALASFLVRLRPLLLFAAVVTIQGVFGLIQAAHSNLPSANYVVRGLFISGGVGLAIAHLLLYLRKAVGVYPAATDLVAISMPERKPLREALRSYWKTLIGVALFPAIVSVGGKFLHVPFEYLIVPFFAVWFLAAWPYLSGKAPYTFCLIAMLVYLGGTLFAVLLVIALRLTLA